MGVDSAFAGTTGGSSGKGGGIGSEAGQAEEKRPELVDAAVAERHGKREQGTGKRRGGKQGHQGRSRVNQAPDLGIEVVSPTERTIDTQSKVNDYLRTRTREVWVVYPETQQVIVHHPDGTAAIYNAGQTIPGGELLPGFSLAVADIFDVYSRLHD